MNLGEPADTRLIGKRRRYGGDVVAFVVEFTGRLYPPSVRILRQLASYADDPDREMAALVAELQCIVISASLSSQRGARGLALG